MRRQRVWHGLPPEPPSTRTEPRRRQAVRASTSARLRWKWADLSTSARHGTGAVFREQTAWSPNAREAYSFASDTWESPDVFARTRGRGGLPELRPVPRGATHVRGMLVEDAGRTRRGPASTALERWSVPHVWRHGRPVPKRGTRERLHGGFRGHIHRPMSMAWPVLR